MPVGLHVLRSASHGALRRRGYRYRTSPRVAPCSVTQPWTKKIERTFRENFAGMWWVTGGDGSFGSVVNAVSLFEVAKDHGRQGRYPCGLLMWRPETYLAISQVAMGSGRSLRVDRCAPPKLSNHIRTRKTQRRLVVTPDDLAPPRNRVAGSVFSVRGFEANVVPSTWPQVASWNSSVHRPSWFRRLQEVCSCNGEEAASQASRRPPPPCNKFRRLVDARSQRSTRFPVACNGAV